MKRERYTDLSEARIGEIIQNREPVELLVPRDAANMENVMSAIPESTSDEWLQVAPTSIVELPEVAFAVYTQSTNDARGSWMRFGVLIHRMGGSIGYRQHDDADLLTRVDFTR